MCVNAWCVDCGVKLQCFNALAPLPKYHSHLITQENTVMEADTKCLPWSDTKCVDQNLSRDFSSICGETALPAHQSFTPKHAKPLHQKCTASSAQQILWLHSSYANASLKHQHVIPTGTGGSHLCLPRTTTHQSAALMFHWHQPQTNAGAFPSDSNWAHFI